MDTASRSAANMRSAQVSRVHSARMRSCANCPILRHKLGESASEDIASARADTSPRGTTQTHSVRARTYADAVLRAAELGQGRSEGGGIRPHGVGGARLDRLENLVELVVSSRACARRSTHGTSLTATYPLGASRTSEAASAMGDAPHLPPAPASGPRALLGEIVAQRLGPKGYPTCQHIKRTLQVEQMLL